MGQAEKMTNTSGMNEYESVEVPVQFQKTLGKSMIRFEISQSRDRTDIISNGFSNNEWTHTLSSTEQKKEECRTWRQSIIRNWKILKKYVYPVELLDELCTRELLKRGDFGDLNEMNQSLAQDIVLTASYNKIETQRHFGVLKDAVKCLNPRAHIEWDASDSGELPSEKVKITSNNIRSILRQKVKGNVAIDIKDEFLIQRIITVDEHEQIAQDLRSNPVSEKFIQMIIEKRDKRSFDCLVYSLQKFNEKQKKINQINIRTLLDNLCGPRKTSDSSNTGNSVEIVQSEMNQSISAHNGCKITLKLADNNEQEQSSFHENVEQNLTNMTSYFGQVLGGYQTGTDKGSVIIFLKSLESDMGNRIQQSLKDGSFVKLLDKLFNDKDIRTSLSKGEYKLEVTIEPYEGQVFKEESEYLPVNEMSSLSNLIKANRSFLIDQINAMALLKAFNTETSEKFNNAGIHDVIEITEKAEVFLNVVDEEGFHEEFYNILKKIRMTYVLNRLKTYQEVCSADYPNMRRNIIQKFGLLVSSIDIDDMKGTFIERKVFDIPMFDKLEEQFGENQEQATAAFLIEILKIGRKAVVTLVDVLYINAMDELATNLLAPLKLTTVDEEDADIESCKSEGLLFEGTFRVFVKEMDSYAMEKKEASGETELQPDVILEKDKARIELHEKPFVEQESQRLIKDKKKNQVEIVEIDLKSDGPGWPRQGTQSLQMHGPKPRVKKEVGPPSFFGKDERFQRSVLRPDRGMPLGPPLEPAPKKTMHSFQSNRSQLFESPPNRYRQRRHYKNRSRGFVVGAREMDSHAKEKKEAVQETCLKKLNFAEVQPDVILEKDKPRTKLDEKPFVEQTSHRLIKGVGPNWHRPGTPLLQVHGPRSRVKKEVGPTSLFGKDERFQRSLFRPSRRMPWGPLLEPTSRQTMYSSRNRSPLFDSPPNRFRPIRHYKNRSRDFVGARDNDDFDGSWDRYYSEGSRAGIDGPLVPFGYDAPRYFNDFYGPRDPFFGEHRSPVGFDRSSGYSDFDRHRGRGGFGGTRGRDDFDEPSFSFGYDRSMEFYDVDGQRSRSWFDRERGMPDMSQC